MIRLQSGRSVRLVELGVTAIGAVAALLGGMIVGSSAASSMLVLMVAVGLLILLILVRFGFWGITSACVFAGFATLGLTGVRISSFAAVSDVFFLGTFLMLLLTSLMGPLEFRVPEEARFLLRGGVMLVMGSLLGSVLSPEPAESIMAFTKLVIAVLVIPLLLLFWNPSREQLVWCTMLFVCSASASAAAAWIIGPPDQFTDRSYGLATHPNSMALISVLALGPTLAYVLYRRGVLRILMGFFAILLSWSVLFASGSRAGAIALVAMLVTFVVLIRSRRALWCLVVVLFAAVVLSALGWFESSQVTSLNRLLGPEGSDAAKGALQSNMGRLEALREAREDFLANPFFGVGMYRSGAAINAYISILVTSGLLGILGLGAVMIDALRTGMRVSSTQSGDLLFRALALGWVAGFLGLMVGNTFQNAIWERYVWIGPTIIVLMSYRLSCVSTQPEVARAELMHTQARRAISIPTDDTVRSGVENYG